MRHSIRIWGTAGLLWCLLGVAHAQEYVTVEPRELVDNPQRYWARGIVFKDTLVRGPDRRTIQLGQRRVRQFSTRAVGRVYVDAALASAINDMALDRDYLFSGTVYHHRRAYYIVVQGVMATMKDLTDLPTAVERLRAQSTNTVYGQTLRKLELIQDRIQAELLAFATENGITVPELFEPESPHRIKVRATIHNAFMKMEEEDKAPASDFFVSLVAAVMAQAYGEPGAEVYGEEDVAPFPVTEEAAAPEEEESPLAEDELIEEEPADQPVVEKPIEDVAVDQPVIEESPVEPEPVPEELPIEEPEEEEEEIDISLPVPLRASPLIPKLEMPPVREAVIRVVKPARIELAALVPARIVLPAPASPPPVQVSNEIDISELARRPIRWR
jgi:hypothetical protein